MTGAAAAFFEAIAGRYDRVYAPSSAESRRRMARVLAELPSRPARILDLGVGTGRELTALLDAGHSPTGIDASKTMLERCAKRGRTVPLLLADFWGPLPFPDGAFDAVIALHGTLAHPPDPFAMRRLAHEMGRLVCQGGVFVAEVPSPGWLAALDAAPEGDERRAARTGPRTCRIEDLVVGVSIEARAFDEAEWRAAFAPTWTMRLEVLTEIEWFVVARRT